MTTPEGAGYVTANPGTGDLSKQWEWHANFRDASKNMYRTTTQDAMEFREVAVKSKFPSGYAGHCAKKAHDVMYNNTVLAQEIEYRQVNPFRDSKPSFAHQIDGSMTYAKSDKEDTPLYGTMPDSNVVSPWGVFNPIHAMPSYKTTPALTPEERAAVKPAK